VFDTVDALTAADHLLLFRNGVRQALRRAGYHASFVCRPPFAGAVASGWHLHQSWVHLQDGRNAFSADDALLSSLSQQVLAGLLVHARGMAALCTTTINGYGRFQPGAMAPTSVVWARDSRGAMLRVIGGAGHADTRIENRCGEPMANPYLCMAAQVHAGLDGVLRQLVPPPPSDAPYAPVHERLPTSLPEALDVLAANAVLQRGFGAPLMHLYDTVKRQEHHRFCQAQDPAVREAHEYFARF
jgi:glutamine synthetase